MKARRRMAFLCALAALSLVQLSSAAAEPAAKSVQRIARARHEALPAAHVKRTPGNRKTVITISNKGDRPASAYFKGPEAASVRIAPHKNAQISLKPGAYGVAVEPTGGTSKTAPALYGEQTYERGARYWLVVYQPRKPSVAAREAGRTRPPKPQRNVKQAVERIKKSPHSTLSPPEVRHTTGPVGKGMTLENHTPFALVFYFLGPTENMIEIAAGRTADIALVVGKYEVAVEAHNPPGVIVRPFYGRHDYGPDAHYWMKLYTSDPKR